MKALDVLLYSLAAVTLGAGVCLGINWARLERRNRLELRAERLAFKHRLRARIVLVGQVSIDPQGNPQPVGWAFDCMGFVPVVIVVSDGEKPVTLWGGYTAEELAQIAQSPSEFVT